MRIFFISRLVEINSHHIKMNNPDEVPLASFKLDLSTSSCGVPFCMPGTQVYFRLMDVTSSDVTPSDVIS